jgi:hypothetical protein
LQSRASLASVRPSIDDGLALLLAFDPCQLFRTMFPILAAAAESF